MIKSEAMRHVERGTDHLDKAQSALGYLEEKLKEGVPLSLKNLDDRTALTDGFVFAGILHGEEEMRLIRTWAGLFETDLLPTMFQPVGEINSEMNKCGECRDNIG